LILISLELKLSSSQVDLYLVNLLPGHSFHRLKLHFIQLLLLIAQFLGEVIDLSVIFTLHVLQVADSVILSLEFLNDLVDICHPCGLFDLI
jgi:hypothetical protein